jgi:hypothetical protein
MAGACEHGNGSSISIIGGEFLDQLCDCQFLEDSTDVVNDNDVLHFHTDSGTAVKELIIKSNAQIEEKIIHYLKINKILSVSLKGGKCLE